MVDKIAVASFVSSNDQLCVVANESGHHANTTVKKHVLNSSTENINKSTKARFCMYLPINRFMSDTTAIERRQELSMEPR